MDTFETLSKNVREIDDLCEKLIRKAIPVMKFMVTNRDSIVKDIRAKNPLITNDKLIKECMQKLSLSLVTDAKLIKKEMGTFVNCLTDNHPIGDCDGLSFLKEVWCGDMYSSEKLAALVELKGDLVGQIKNCTVDLLTERIVKEVNGSTQ